MAKLEDLRNKCKLLGLTPLKSRNRIDKETKERFVESTVDDCILALQYHYISKYGEEGTLNPFVTDIIEYKPMLASQMKSIKEENQPELWIDNNEWLISEKIDGNRMRFCFDVNKGSSFFSRNIAEGQDGDFLPIEYSGNLLIAEPDKEALSNANIFSFILDCELVPVNNTINDFINIRRVKGEEIEVTETPVADTALNLTTSVLGALPDLAKRIQSTNPLKLVVFDIIKINELDIRKLSLSKRLTTLNHILRVIKPSMGNQIELVRQAIKDKENFYNDILLRGGEGCVLKNINSPYTGKRDKNWIKAKRSVTGSFLEEQSGDTLDAFIIGFKPGNPGTAFEHLIGALDFGAYLIDSNGNFVLDQLGQPVLHHLATISGIDLNTRKEMTEIVDGQVRLKLAYYNKVAEIDGQDVSSKNLRLMHATLLKWRPDRDSFTCKIQKSFLESLIL